MENLINSKELFSLVVMILQLSVVLIGFPAQIIKNYNANKNGEANTKIILVFLTFFMRFANTLWEGVWYIYIPDSIAVIMILITLLQIKKPRNFLASIIVRLYQKKVN